MNLRTLTGYLDDYLSIRSIPDYKGAYNGLQVDGPEEVNSIAVAVDACLYTIERSISLPVDLLIVHHGLFWGATAPVTETYYRRVAGLIKNNIGLYSSHLPLDAHPEVGNNQVLARKLGLTPSGTFGDFEGVPIGVTVSTELTRDAFVDRVREALGIEPLVIAAGPSEVRSVGLLTGGGGSWIDRAKMAGLDTYLTGEGAHHTFFEAEERGINVIYAGHYATETVGVRALGDHLASRFGFRVVFIDHPTGL